MKSICFAILSTYFFASSSYSVPPVINYAGQVRVGGEAFDGEGFFKFAIVNDSGSIHITQTNNTATVGQGGHVTTQSNGVSFRDYYDKDGNYKESDY